MAIDMTNNTSGVTGLTSSEVAARIAAGQVNVDAGVKTRSIRQIIAQNSCTLFNAINVVLAVLVLFTGSYKNILFMLVILCNTAIGIVQEIRSKRITDALSIVAASEVKVVRDGSMIVCSLEDLVRDDVVKLRRGDQVPADAVVLEGEGEVNESLLTGESRLIKKCAGDQLMSGSFVDAGVIYARVVHVGAENYAAQISAEAKRYQAVNSEILTSLKKIITFISFVIFPVGILLFVREHFLLSIPFDATVLSVVSALVGMIPEGLILLTSMVLAVAVVRLSKSRVLVQQLYCIETLARVDILCLDKTGTITTGKMEVVAVQGLEGADKKQEAELNEALYAIVCADNDPNDTAMAIIDYYAHKIEPAAETHRLIPFSSERKYSGVELLDGRAYVVGASQFIGGEETAFVQTQQNELADTARVLLVARVDGFTEQGHIKGRVCPLGFVTIHDQIRESAAYTIRYFKEQGVDVKVLSGDDPRTVSGIACQVGIAQAHNFVDASTLTKECELAYAIENATVFGRVKPEQKKDFVIALQKQGHIVAMTGDGVNDTLALKQADCSVAMAAGSDAARNVAQLVLVDNNFASMPKVVAEGRRSINNLQRSASLFLVKTLLSMILAVLFILLPWQYPFQPIQMTLISAFTIGIPSFVLALEPNKERVKGSFLEYIIVHAVPGALCALITVVVMNFVGYTMLGLSYAHVSTLCVLLSAWIGIQLIISLSRPLTPIRSALLVVVVGGICLGATVFHKVFGIVAFTPSMIVLFVIAALLVAGLFHVLYGWFHTWHARRLEQVA